MKLVAAKCPSCGASIEVNSNEETTKCKYCKQAILIDDAIAKYKLEISGEVEVKNLPKIDNLLKVANRHFNNNNYEDAYETYDEVLKLDPDNTLALIRYSICKTYLNNGIDFKMDHLLKTFKNVVELLHKQNKYDELIEDYIKDISRAIEDSIATTTKYYNSYTMTEVELKDIQAKLYSCLELYEELYNSTKEQKEILSQRIVSSIDNIRIKKAYKTGYDEYGKNNIKYYKISINENVKLLEKRKLYSKNKDEEETTNTLVEKDPSTKSKKMTAAKAWSIFLGFLVFGCLVNGEIITSIPLVLLILLLLYGKKKIKLFETKKYLYTITIVVLVIIFLSLFGQ